MSTPVRVSPEAYTAAVRIYLGYPDIDTPDCQAVVGWVEKNYPGCSPTQPVQTAAFWVLSKYMEGRATARYKSLDHFIELAKEARRRGAMG